MKIFKVLLLSCMLLAAAIPDDEVKLTRLPDGVNKVGRIDHPILTPDGLTMYFYKHDSKGHKDNLWVTRQVNGYWLPAEPMSIETKVDEAINCVSADGNILIIQSLGYKPNIGNWDFYFRKRTKDGWSHYAPFPRGINSSSYEGHGTLSSDSSAFIFCSARGGGMGGNDIYVSIKHGDRWSHAFNLGTMVNTHKSELSPYLHADGRTLYFSSAGHDENYGGFDVYKTVRIGNTWTNWSKPQNLGKKINGHEHEVNYIIPLTGDIAYFAKDFQIYSITLPKEARPELQVVSISGTVMDENGKHLEAELKWEDLTTGSNVGVLKSNPQDGSYLIAIPVGSYIGYYAEKEGYFPVSKNIDLRKVTNRFDIRENIILNSIKEMKEKGTTVTINNIFFDYDKATLQPASFKELDRLARIIKDNPEEKVEISGHTDDQGAEFYNLQLSKKRAMSVVNYLVSQGCSETQLISKGYGELKPVDPTKTEKARAKNRRVEFKFIEDK